MTSETAKKKATIKKKATVAMPYKYKSIDKYSDEKRKWGANAATGVDTTGEAVALDLLVWRVIHM